MDGDGHLSTTTVALIVIGLGIPHGAADHLIFRARRPGENSGRSTLRFTLFYLLLILSYGLLWLTVPALALGLFLTVSVYHFGQAQVGKRREPRPRTVSRSLLWGCFALFFPILLHYPQAQPIIEGMLHRPLPLPPYWTVRICFLLVMANAYFIILTPRDNYRERTAMRRQLLDLLLLTLLYLTTDLLMGFAVFFLLWHSIPAAVAQWRYLRGRQLSKGVGHYLQQLLPLSLGAAVSLGTLYYLWSGSPGAGPDLGAVFILISLISLPHAFLVDAVYR